MCELDFFEKVWYNKYIGIKGVLILETKTKKELIEERVEENKLETKSIQDIKNYVKDFIKREEERVDREKQELPPLKVLGTFKVFRSIWYPSLKNYPKHERENMVRIIKENLIEFEALIQRARFVKSIRLKTLQEAQGVLFTLQSCISISSDEKYISKNFRAQLELLLEEVSKMLVSFILSCGKSKA